MGIVFQGYPNIHGKAEHYEGGVITQQMKGDHFQNIKSRYLEIMRSQLAAQQIPGSAQENFIKGLKDAKFEKLENVIESQLVNAYNEAAASIGNISSIYRGISNKLATGIKGRDQAKVIEALNDLIAIFKNSSNEMSLINDINTPGLAPISAELYELLGIGNLINAVNKLENGELKYSDQWINGLLTPSSEVLASYIDTMAEQASDEKVLHILKSSQLGTKSLKVVADFGRGGKKTIQTKSADIKMRNIQFDVTTTLSNNQVSDSITLNVDSYATVKTYRRNTITKMISYAGTNSIAMNLLHQLYGNSDQTNYQLYNTLAFYNSNKGKGDLGENFKIIRSDLVAQAAEKYIIGYSQKEAQRVMIHNYKAYPILSVLAAIAQQASEKTKDGGQYIRNAIFNIQFDNLYKVKNQWKTGDGSPDELKLSRIQETVAAINAISTRGFLSFNQLNKFILSTNEDGISLKDIVPKT